MFGKNHTVLTMHQMTGFDHLTLGARGLDPRLKQNGPARIYIERSFFAGNTVYVTKGTDLSSIPWLKDVGLAPEEVIEVPHHCLFNGLKVETEMMQELKSKVKNGGRIQFFRPTELEAELIMNLGLSWENTLSCDPAIANPFSNKATLRRMAVDFKMQNVFPPHQIVTADWTQEKLLAAVSHIQSAKRRMGMNDVLLKRTDLAGGEGFCLWSSKELHAFMDTNRGQELIIEVAVQPHIPLSNQWMIMDGTIKYVGSSQQLQHGFVHKGNIIAYDDDVLDKNLMQRLAQITKPFAEYANSIGYNGVLGFDAVYDKPNDRLFLVEANARITATYYAFALVSRLTFKPWSVAYKIIEPSLALETFDDVRKALGHYLFTPAREHGAVPYMLSGLRLPDGQRRLGIMAVANYAKTAEIVLTEAEKRLAA